MKLTLREGLLFASISVVYQEQMLMIPDVVIDTGSASTLLAADWLARIDILPGPHDILYTVRGVGGTEVVFSRRLDQIQIASHIIPDFDIEIGGVEYGFDINGILGTDFLLRAKAVIDLQALELMFHD
jgi:hypothetical protein